MSLKKPSTILFDTNVLLDLVLTFRASHDEVIALYDSCQKVGISTCCVPLSLKDVFYVVPHQLRDMVKGYKPESEISELELTTVSLIGTKLA